MIFCPLHKIEQPIKVILIDNFDSFSYNLVDQFRQLGCEVTVYRNDVSIDKIFTPQVITYPNKLIVLSPGPGSPKDAGNSLSIIKRFSGIIPILGICLGHQAIVAHFGGNVCAAKAPLHGKAASIELETHPVFKGLAIPFLAARYHSLITTEIPTSLKIIARCQQQVMAVQHSTHQTLGFQFHPESILTTQGNQLISNAITWLMSKHDHLMVANRLAKPDLVQTEAISSGEQ